MRGACASVRRRGDGGGQIDSQRGGLRHDMSDLTLKAIEESCAFGEGGMIGTFIRSEGESLNNPY